MTLEKKQINENDLGGEEEGAMGFEFDEDRSGDEDEVDIDDI